MNRTATSSQSLGLYFIAIGGTGMAPLACLLKEQGHRVTGSDGPVYPPMSTLLADAGIRYHEGFDPAHLRPPPDLVVVGNAVPRDNPEAVEMERLGLPRVSMPEALARFLLVQRSPLVVAGTHGKTSTSSLAAWVYSHCGEDPGYLIGGLPRGLPTSFHAGSGRRFIVEGDEYNAAYFDRGAKFLHYGPETVVLTSVEYDHADLYPSLEALHAAYRALLETLPEDGLVVACGDSGEVREIAGHAPCPVVFYGLQKENEIAPVGAIESASDGSHFHVVDPEAGKVPIELRLWGDHNVSNALAVWAVARRDRLPVDKVVEAMGLFRGARRRLERLGERQGVVVIDDFAHHPTEVGASLAALRQGFPEGRLVALFEPRSLTAGRRFLTAAYRRAFSLADRVLLAPIYHAKRLGVGECLDLAALARDLSAAGVPITCCTSVDEVLARAVAEARPGDVLVAMSSGDFQALPQRLLQALEDDPTPA